MRVVDGEIAAVCSIVWYEYLLGPLVDDEADLARAFVSGRIESMTEKNATLGADLFNAVGRKRKLKTDALVAATAIHADADLVTLNVADFELFVGHGLRMLRASV